MKYIFRQDISKRFKKANVTLLGYNSYIKYYVSLKFEMNLFNLSYFTMSIDAHSSVVDVAEVCEVFKKLSTKVRKIFFLSSFHFNPFPSPGYMPGLIFYAAK